MKVISMVPSWTETLIAAGIDVVGRTNFCLHPADKVKDIPKVGGTKNWDFDQILKLAPDHIILDKEENPKFMGEQTQVPTLVTHIESADDVSRDLNFLASELKNTQLNNFADAWELIIEKLPISQGKYSGIIEWGTKPTTTIEHVIYLIWRDPWMAVSKNTFIGSMLELSGYHGLIKTHQEKYPKVSLEDIDNKDSTLLLFSSEPYPFHKKRNELEHLGFPYAFVDGESFSWFGLRSLQFLSNLS